MGKLILFPNLSIQETRVSKSTATFLDLDGVMDELDILHGMRGAPVEAFEEVLEYVDQLRQPRDEKVRR